MAASLDNQLLEEMTLYDLGNYETKSVRGKKKIHKLGRLARTALFNPMKKERERAQRKIWESYSEVLQSVDVMGNTVVAKMRDGTKSRNYAVCLVPDYLMDQPYHPVLFSD